MPGDLTDTKHRQIFDPDQYTYYSADNGPESEIATANEQHLEETALYPNLSLLGINLFAGKALQELLQLSVRVTKGKVVRSLVAAGDGINHLRCDAFAPTPCSYIRIEDGEVEEGVSSLPPSFRSAYYGFVLDSTCYFPDVYLDTLRDPVFGLGQYVQPDNIDYLSLVQAKRFCIDNQFYFDGVVFEKKPWRSWAYQTARYSLLELTLLDGKFGLNPINNSATVPVPIAGFFTNDNILEDSFKEEFLPFAENRLVKLKCIWRDNSNDFPKKRSVIAYINTDEGRTAPEEEMDLSDSVTNIEQAVAFSKIYLNTKRYSTSAVEFKTVMEGLALAPGAFIYVMTSHVEWNPLYVGIVGNGGQLRAGTTPPNWSANDITLLVYKSGMDSPQKLEHQVVEDGALVNGAVWEGSYFLVGEDRIKKRCYRVEELSLESGEVAIRALYYPLTEQGTALIASNENITIIR